jgi:hypothetical protein
MENIIIYEPKKSHKILQFVAKEPWFAIFLAVIILAFGTVTVCRAYDFVLQQYMENSLKQAAQSAQTAYNACEANRQAYLQWKTDSNIKPTGVDVCRTF